MRRADGSMDLIKKQGIPLNEVQRRSLGPYCKNGFQSVAKNERTAGSAHIVKLRN
jgi:hypothetical protein